MLSAKGLWSWSWAWAWALHLRFPLRLLFTRVAMASGGPDVESMCRLMVGSLYSPSWCAVVWGARGICGNICPCYGEKSCGDGRFELMNLFYSLKFRLQIVVLMPS